MASAVPNNRVYLFRLQKLIIDGGVLVLRHIFDHKLQLQNISFSVCLSQEKGTLTRLRSRNRITQPQYDFLYPASGQPPTTSDLYITLIICLLRNLKICGLNRKYNWTIAPQAGDTCLEADIYRLVQYINELGIPSTTDMNLQNFKSKWTDIEQILLRLNNSVSVPVPGLQKFIDEIRTSPLDPEAGKRTEAMIEKWMKMMNDLEVDGKLAKADAKLLKDEMKVLQSATDKQKSVVTDIKNIGMLPREILNMDRRAIELYIKALSEGETKVRNIRLMIVGHYGAGKTTLAKRLFRERVDITERKSTDGIDVYVGRRKVSLKNKTWFNADGQRKVLVDRLATLMHNTNEKEKQLSVSPEETSRFDTQRNTTFQSDSTDMNEPSGADVSPTLAPSLSATEMSHKNALDEENYEENEDFRRHQNHLKEFVTEAKYGSFVNDEMHCDLALWDFAGQSIFYATHQAFLSRRAIYLLVFDISKHITDIVEDDIWRYDCKGEQKCKTSEFIEYWLNSIHEFCSYLEEPGPPVILVGTFADKLEKRSDQAEKTLCNVRSSLLGKVANCHLQDKHFYVDNSLEENENTEKLRQYIVKVASEQSHWDKSMPARWITLEERLIRLKEEHNVKVIQMEEFHEENRQLPVPIKEKDELDLFLKFHHETGTILYFGDDNMQNDILLEPQWLIDAFKSLITAAMFCIPKSNIQTKWHEFDLSAILKPDLISLIWQEEENSSYLAHKDLILRFMEKLGFCARPKKCIGELTQAEDFYLVPCMLKYPPPAKIVNGYDSQQCKSTGKLCVTNHKEPDKRFIPTTAFNKLIAACIKEWPLAIENNKYMIFCGGAEFQLEDNHFLYIFLYDQVIQIWISRKSKAGHSPSTMVCLEVKDKIETILKENVRMHSEMLSFVKCPWNNLYSNENMIRLKEDDQDRDIVCHCQEEDHVVTYMDLASCWLPVKSDQGRIDSGKPPRETHERGIAIPQQGKQLPDVWPDEAAMTAPITVVPVNLRSDLLNYSDNTDVYSMKKSCRGRCLILSNETFKGPLSKDKKTCVLPPRQRTVKDVNGLKELFKQLHFNVITREDRTAKEMLSDISNEAKHSYHDQAECFVCVICSHGTKKGIYGVDGNIVSLGDITRYFDGTNCKRLQSKPKLFFIQACQGETKDRPGSNVADCTAEGGQELPYLEKSDETDADNDSQHPSSVPTKADMLVACATHPGYVSLRNKYYGSWFIQAVIYVFQKYACEEDIFGLLILVNRLVARGRTASNVTQASKFEASLTKKFFFFPGNVSNSDS